MSDQKEKKILLITSGQPSLNPRLVKEADTLADNGYSVTVLYAYWNEWGTAYDAKLLPKKKWRAFRVGGDPTKRPFTFLLSRIIHKLAVFGTRFSKSAYFSELAIARSSFFLIREAKKHHADLYIAHNLGALPAAVKSAKSYHKPAGFDAEDFHRYEITNDNADKGVILKKFIEDKYIPQLTYLSTSSPGISAAYHQLYPDKSPFTILNVFPKSKGSAMPAANGTLRLFWFSQTISLVRGVKDCISALHLLKRNSIELHLLGYIEDEVKQQLISGCPVNIVIKFYPPMPPDDIFSFASQFDIGLALEDNFPFNRDICLTNKIFTYMQAGLAIIASGTTAQKDLLNKHPEIGMVYEPGNIQALAKIIQDYDADRNALLKSKRASHQSALDEFNWEVVGRKFTAQIKTVLPN